MSALHIRRFLDKDSVATAQIFFAAIQQGTIEYYSQQQRDAWAPYVPEADKWCQKLQNQISFVAETDNRVIGFMTVTHQGYIDLAFVTPKAISSGVAGRLYQVIEQTALAAGASRLTTHASLGARGFFERYGWKIEKQQTVHVKTYR